MAETAPRYDTDVANERLMALGSLIVADPKYQAGWNALSLVIDLDGKSSAYGYVYRDDDWEARAPRSFDVLDAAESLQKAMAVDGVSWKACLIQIARPAMSIHVDFEYERADRWKVTPQNTDAMVEALRPRP